ncbi:MAG TPA: efflux RND transporter periplasmic adaptor subunit [Usitatibacter sp.]|nr:efflux RND transporter periplasmic adaptor subunit [Usitatibacter sp.]
MSYWAGSRSAPAPAAAKPAAAPAKAPPGVVIEATKVSVVRLPQALTAVGSLRSDETVILRPEVAGRVAQILFKEGERVAKGQVLVKLDASVQQADLDKARANLVLAKTKFERAVDLRNKGFLSGQARDEAENNLKVAEAEAELMQARAAKTSIRAPFSGTIGLRMVSVGDYVKEGQDMVNLESLDPLKVDFRVPETAMSLLKDSQTLQITLDAIPDKAYDGRVVAINPLIDANGRSVVIRAQVPNRDGRLRPGMFARVRLFTSGLKDTLVVPEESLFPVGDDKYVYKVVDGKATRQKIEIGARREGRVEVVNGLGPDDTVVTAGVIKLREGVPVTVANAPAAPAAQPVLNTAAPKTKG